MRIAYFDCLSGISGDMTLGALVDAGASLDRIREGVQSLGLPEVDLQTKTVRKCGFRACQLTVSHPSEHAHRHLHHIESMIESAAAVSAGAKGRARNIFHAIAVAEAKVHGSTIEKIHFHEVGAVDSIADIVGCAIALDDLGIDAVEASAVPTGSGYVTIAHGRVSIPAPATAELLCDIPIAPSTIEAELTTPTGAAILKATARRFGTLPAMTPQTIGYGAGTRDLEGQANVLRVLIGETDAARSTTPLLYDRITILKTNIDNTSAEDLAAAASQLFAAGALDVTQTPCVMKKGRTGVELTVQCSENRANALETLLFQATGTIGIRRWTAERHKLPRRDATRETALGPVRGKECQLPDGRWRFAVEADVIGELAASRQLTAPEVRRLIEQPPEESDSGDHA